MSEVSVSQRIAQVVVGLPVEGPFDYKLEGPSVQDLSAGARVWVSFRNQRRVGYTVGFVEQSRIKNIKPVLALIDKIPILNDPLLELTRQVAEHYASAWGETIETALPELLRRGKPVDWKNATPPEAETANDHEPEFLLLHDPFVQKRWPYLLEKIKATLAQNKGVIFLVPEVSMIPLVLKKFKDIAPGAISVVDKSVKHPVELENWIRIKLGEATLIVGTRSAAFAPVVALGLLIVYDEDNPSYKQEQAPFYHARETAFMRADIEKSSLIYVSSAPSAEVWVMAQKKKLKLLTLNQEATTATTNFIDLSNYKFQGSSYISFPLRNHIEQALRDKRKIILVMNRRGFNLLTRCASCGYTFQCPRCNVNLTTSYARKRLVCRMCNYTTGVPAVCPKCRHPHLQSLGTGIEKLESETARIFPQARLARYDKDSTQVPTGFDILIATQAVLRVKEQLNVQLVGVISIDGELNRFDFRSGHRAFALLVHLRELAKEKLVVQTRLIDHYTIKAARNFDFQFFYQEEIALREELGFPPFRHAVAIGIRSVSEAAAMTQAFQLYENFKQFDTDTVSVQEPHPDLLPKLRDKYRFTIHIRAKSLKPVLVLIKKALKEYKKKKDVLVSVNVDP